MAFFRRRRAITSVVDTIGWSRRQTVENCRQILSDVRDDAAWLETDIPVVGDDWPEDVVAAADLLREHARTSGRVEKSGYATTGVLEADDATWLAFVTLAPWAYDATVWDRSWQELVSLNDEGTSVTRTSG